MLVAISSPLFTLAQFFWSLVQLLTRPFFCLVFVILFKDLGLAFVVLFKTHTHFSLQLVLISTHS
jgi:hypothetical protein